MPKSLLLLGGSRQQVVAIEKAKELGFRTVLCDYLPDNPGQYVADAFYQVSTTDRDAVLEVARAEGVDGVLAYASDPAAPTAAYVAEQMGLPTNPLASVEVLSEKHLFREFLAGHGLASPKAVSVSAGEPVDAVLAKLDGFRWPVVVKPTDSSGSKGVTVVEGSGDLGAALAAARERSRNGVLIVEEFIQAGYDHVIGGDVFVVDGTVVFWGLMDCLREKGGLVPVGKLLPSGLPADAMARCHEEIQRLVTALGLQFGELNVELIVDSNGQPHFLELGARAGGNMIPVQLSDASGKDLVEANVLAAMGQPMPDLAWDGSTVDEPWAHLVLHGSEDGRFAGVALDDIAAEAAYRTVLYQEVGDPVSAFGDAGDAVGILFLKGPAARTVADAPSSHVSIRLD